MKASLQPLHPERLGQEETQEAIVWWLGVLDRNDVYSKSDRDRMI